MARRSRFGIVDLLLLALTLLVAAGVRIVYVIHEADKGHSEGPLLVQEAPPEQDALVQNLSGENRWFFSKAPLAGSEEKTAHVSPAYPWLLSRLALLSKGKQLDEALVRWIQCGLGALTAVLYFL